MAHGSLQSVLVGYSECLDRRPLKFVDPIPPALHCNACGNVPRLTFSLVCGHVLCEPCYHSCATTSECLCPLDDDVSGMDDVISRNYPAENLLRRKVRCWNESNGCRLVLPASQIAEHVRHDCQYHVTRCPKCSTGVLSRDVCAHLKSRCTALAFHGAPRVQLGANESGGTHLAAFERKVEQRVREIHAKLAQLALEIDSLSDKLAELCHNNNDLKEALTEQFGPALDRNLAEIKALYSEKKRKPKNKPNISIGISSS